MSKIFLNHNYRLFRLTTLPQTASNIEQALPVQSLIDILCYDETNPHIIQILQNIANCIIANNLYKPSYAASKKSGSLIPLNSKLFSSGTNTHEKPNVNDILDQLELKLKIDEPSKSIDQKFENFRTGHFRFHLPLLLSPQILIFVQSSSDNGSILLFFKGYPKLLSVIISYIVNNIGYLINTVSLDNIWLRNCLDWASVNDQVTGFGDIELWFGKMGLGFGSGSLGSIVINIEERYVNKLLKTANNKELTVNLYRWMEKETGIDFNKLNLVRIKCGLFNLSCDGRVRFSLLMSHLNDLQKTKNFDDRLSIWWIIEQMFRLIQTDK